MLFLSETLLNNCLFLFKYHILALMALGEIWNFQISSKKCFITSTTDLKTTQRPNSPLKCSQHRVEALAPPPPRTTMSKIFPFHLKYDSKKTFKKHKKWNVYLYQHVFTFALIYREYRISKE